MTDGADVLDVLVIGAGFSGICAGIKLKNAGYTNFRIVEKSTQVGGTWYSNTYPGAACDIPSHLYCYSFEPNPNWSRKFAPQSEILKYINNCTDKYGIRNYITHGKKVLSLILDEKTGIWAAEIEDGEKIKARHVINGMGGLHIPNIPPFKDMERFSGPSMHSANWGHAVDFTNKCVAVIGSAASAIQIIPELQKICKQVDIYQRTPNYIAPRNDRPFTEAEKNRFSQWPLLGKLYRWLLYKRTELITYPLTKPKSRMSLAAMKRLKAWVRQSVKDEALQNKLIPEYIIGCKRILLSDTFYSTLNKDNVTLITTPIEQIMPDGIQDREGTFHPADIIVYATGYDVHSHMHSIKVVGTGGVSLKALGDEGEQAFKGAVHTQFPNYYLVTGPNTGVGTTSVVYMIELQLDYIVKLIQAAGRDKLISVKKTKMDAYNEHIQEALSKSVWASGCDSWYLREDGKIVTLYPGKAQDFARDHATLDLENYDLQDVTL